MILIQKYQQGKMINYLDPSRSQQAEQQPAEQQPKDDSILKYLNFMSPSSLVGATVKKLAGDTKSFTDLVTEGSGVFTEEFHKEHPYISMATNMILDSIIPTARLGVKSPSLILKALPKDMRGRALFVGSAATGGSPTLGKQNALKYFLKGIDIHGNKVNRSDVFRYIYNGKGKENLGAIYTGGTRPVVADYKGMSQAARYSEVPDKLPSIYQVNLGVVDESFDGQKLFQQLREANEINAGILPVPVKIEGGLIVGSREIIGNRAVQEAIDARKVVGHRITPVVVSDEVNGDKALRLLNSGKDPVYKMSIKQRKIRGERQTMTDLEGNPIPGEKGNYTFNTGGINVFFYKKDGKLRRVEIDVYDHARTGNSTKYGTDASNLSFMKKYFSPSQELNNILGKAEDTSSLIVRYNSTMSSADFRHAMVNNFKINPTTKQLVIDEKGIDELIKVVGNSETGKSIEIALRNSSDNIINFYTKQVRDMAKEVGLKLDATTTEKLATQLMERVERTGTKVGRQSEIYQRDANKKLNSVLQKLYYNDHYGYEFIPNAQESKFMEEYADVIANFRRYNNSGATFAFSDDPNAWLEVLNANTTVRNPRVQRDLLTNVRSHNVNAQLRKRAENTILFVNRYQNPATRMGTTDTFFEGLDITPEKIQELHRLLHI